MPSRISPRAFALALTGSMVLAGCWPPLDDLTSVPGASYRDVVLADAPLAYWRLEEPTGATTAVDETPNHHDAQYQGAITSDPDGIPAGGRAANLDGTSGRIYVGDLFSFSGQEPFTLEAWIKPTSLDDAYRRVVAKAKPGTGGPVDGYELDVNKDAPGVVFQLAIATSQETTVKAGPAPTTTDFTHLVLTCDGSNVTLFVNGAIPTGGESIINGAAVGSTSPFVWGASSTLDSFFAGVLDELAVYGTALGATRVTAHYEAGRTAQ